MYKNDNEMFMKALAFATEKHKNQTRKDGTPYIWHPIRVAQFVKDADYDAKKKDGFVKGYDMRYQITALLHDTLEDTDATEEEIAQFGDDVLEAVKLLTRKEGVDEQEYVDAILKNHIAAFVKSCDIIDNMWDTLKCSDKKWAKKYVKKAEFYYKDKFNSAVRKAIGKAKSTSYDDQKHVPCYDYYDMLLNSDKEKIWYLQGKESYLEYDQNVMNPIFNEKVVYGFDEFAHSYFCIIKAEWSKELERGEGVLRLTESGWLPDLSGNPYYDNTRHNDVFDDTLYPADRNKVEKFIKEKVKEGWFYDFVEIEKL